MTHAQSPAPPEPSPDAGTASQAVAVQDAEPYNLSWPERARRQWLAGDWRGLSDISPQALQHHPDRATLAAYRAAASLQLGEFAAGRALAEQAHGWGVTRAHLGEVLLASLRHTLGRASLFGRRDVQAITHFQAAAAGARLSSEMRRHAQDRHESASADLRASVKAAVALRKGGVQPRAVQARDWLVNLAKRCLAAQDVHQQIDHALDTVLTKPGDRAHFLMLVADDFLAQQDRMTALHFLRQATPLALEIEPEQRAALARRLIALGSPESALDVIFELAVADALGESSDAGTAQSAQKAYQRIRSLAQAGQEHGHDLLLAYLERHLGALQPMAGGRGLTVIEIGTTREDVPGQGSTLKLAEFCKRRGLHFVTVDMDPHNSHMARQTFDRLAVPFEAVTAKGEDHLRSLPAPLDFVFLDAYDYDHGMHSALRQSRYEKFLGSHIDEQACHEMHLDCARSLAEKLWQHGAVCVDDTWLENDHWTAKGTLAMPFLLDKGFQLVEARNRAALLVPGDRRPT